MDILLLSHPTVEKRREVWYNASNIEIKTRNMKEITKRER